MTADGLKAVKSQHGDSTPMAWQLQAKPFFGLGIVDWVSLEWGQGNSSAPEGLPPVTTNVHLLV